jgi:glutamate dehydrogenase
VLYLRKAIKSNEDALAIFLTFNVFNHAIMKTNFYKSNIVALSFRLTPSFLSTDFPDKPHGIFYVIGAEFRGFHTRFADVARGGIRLIKSASPQAYSNNISGLFEECYSLASTQQRKNKDIPEGGSKGVILLTLAHQDKPSTAFAKYVDAILDVLLTPHPEIVDHLGRCHDIFVITVMAC